MSTTRRTLLTGATATLALLLAAAPTFAGPLERERAGRDLTPSQSWSDHSARDLKASVRTIGGSEVEVGDRVRFEIRANRSGFGHLYVLSASGRAQLWMENVPMKANSPIRYPERQVDIRATAPEGTDKIVLVYTRTRIAGLEGRGTTRLPVDLDLNGEELSEALDTMMADYPRADWTWARTSVEVVSR